MNERGKKSRHSNKTKAYISAALVHAIIIGALFVNVSNKPKTIEAAYAEKVDVVRATTVDEAQIKKQQDLLKQKDREKERQKKREQQKLKKLKQEAKKEQQRIIDLKEKQKRQQQKDAELEAQRKALALKRQKEEEQRKERLAEQKRQDDLAEAQRKEEELERQQRLQDRLAAEEAFIAEQIAKQRTTTLIQKHLALVGNRIRSVRTLDPNTERWRKSVVNIKVSSSGDVKSVRTIESSGSQQYDKSVETAVYKASPLPIPDASTEPAGNRQFWDFDFVVKAAD